MFYSFVSNVASLNIFPVDKVLFFLEFNDDEAPFNEVWEQMGFENFNIVGNLGIMFVFSFIFLILLFFYLITYWVSYCNKKYYSLLNFK